MPFSVDLIGLPYSFLIFFQKKLNLDVWRNRHSIWEINKMWVLEKIKESVDNLPLELSRMGRNTEDMFRSSHASFHYRLHNNVLTPDKIPEFCLPPRLCKRSPLRAEAMASGLQDQNRSSKIGASNTTMEDPEMKNGDAVKPAKKPLPFSAEAYGLAGMSESANTRRKESLLLSKCPVYVFDRSNAAAVREAKKSSSPHCAKSFPCISSGKGFLRGASSCPSLVGSREDIGKRTLDSLKSSPSCPPSLQGSSLTLVPSIFSPLGVLQSQESLQQKHSLALHGHIKVHLFAERILSANPVSSLSTVRVHVESVEREDDDQRTLDCAVHLCLIPGKIQQKESATTTDSGSPVFKEDFFFTGLSLEDMLELQLRIRVLNRAAAGTFSKRKVIGVIIKPLSQLLNIKTNAGVTQFGSV